MKFRILGVAMAIVISSAGLAADNEAGGISKLQVDKLEVEAARGNLKAQMKLAGLYLNGKAVAVNVEKAIAQYQAAAEQGVTFAQYKLAELYLEGKHVERDPKQAFNWLLRAAQLGYVEAQLELSRLYETGLGVPQSYVNAHKWLNIAVSLTELEVESRQIELEARMSFVQLVQANFLSRWCILKKYQNC